MCFITNFHGRNHGSHTTNSISISTPPWAVIGSLGYTNYQNVFPCDAQTPFGRFAISRDLLATPYSHVGVEVGIQSGNNMRLDVPDETLDALGGLPIQSIMKPMLDVLATARTPELGNAGLFGQLKGGAAYRRWQFDGRNSVKNISGFAGEVQAGIGFPISPSANLSLLYQGIYGGNPKFILNADCPSGRVSTLPIQQGVLLSFSLNVL